MGFWGAQAGLTPLPWSVVALVASPWPHSPEGLVLSPGVACGCEKGQAGAVKEGLKQCLGQGSGSFLYSFQAFCQLFGVPALSSAFLILCVPPLCTWDGDTWSVAVPSVGLSPKCSQSHQGQHPQDLQKCSQQENGRETKGCCAQLDPSLPLLTAGASLR